MVYLRTLTEAFNHFHIKPKDRGWIEHLLLSEGYTPSGICYGVSKSEEKLLRFVNDSRLPNIFVNEVHKNALKSGDPRWQTRKENNNV